MPFFRRERPSDSTTSTPPGSPLAPAEDYLRCREVYQPVRGRVEVASDPRCSTPHATRTGREARVTGCSTVA